MTKSVKDVVVLGGGLAGCTLAYLLKERGYNVVLVEKEEELGGLCLTRQFGGINHEFGPHVLYAEHSSKEQKFFEKFLNNKEHTFFPLLSIDGTLNSLCDFPVTAANILKIPAEDHEQAIEELYEIDLDKPCFSNFSEYVISRVGRTVYKYFFENYNKKQWGIDPIDMDSEWAKFRNLSLRKRGLGMFGDKWQGHPGSYNRLFEKLTSDVEVKKMRVIGAHRNKKFIDSIKTEDGVIKGDFFFSTIPIELLFEAEGLLPYRGVVKYFFLLDSSRVMSSYLTTFPNHYSFTRIVDYRSQSLQEHKYSLISFAFPFDANQNHPSFQVWRKEAEEFIKRNLKSKIVDSFYTEKHYVYPIATFQNINLFKGLLSKLSECENIMTIGRLGLYSYISMDSCVHQCFAIMETLSSWKRFSILEKMNCYDKIRQRLS